MRENLPMIRRSAHRQTVLTASVLAALIAGVSGLIGGHEMGLRAGVEIVPPDAAFEHKRTGANLAACNATVETYQLRVADMRATVEAARCEVAALRDLYARCLGGDCVSRLPDSLCFN